MPKRKNSPTLSNARTAWIFREMLSLRRIYCEDTQFFKMNVFWSWLADESDEDGSTIRIKTHRNPNQTIRAGVVALGDRSTLVVSEEMISKANKGCKLANFTLAHEFSHLALDHHANSAVIKRFQLFDSVSGLANIPPTVEELEANLAAVFFQCGVALLGSDIGSLSLAHRACADVYYVKKAIGLLSVPAFRRELSKLDSRFERVTL